MSTNYEAPYIRQAEMFGMPEAKPVTYCEFSYKRYRCNAEIYEDETCYDFGGTVICEECLDAYLTVKQHKRKLPLNGHEITCNCEINNSPCDGLIFPGDTFYAFEGDIVCMECLHDYLGLHEYEITASYDDFDFYQ